MAASGLTLSSSFTEVAAKCVADDPKLEAPRDKVQKILALYAEAERGCEADDLKVLDVIDNRGELQPDLKGFIRGMYPNVGTRKSQASVVLRVARAVMSRVLGRDVDERLVITEEDLPEYMRPAWKLLPRAGWHSLGRNFSPEKRLSLPLSIVAEWCLKVMLAAHQKCNPTSIEDLFVKHRLEVNDAFQAIVPHRFKDTVGSRLSQIRQGLGIRLREKRSPELDEVPPTLQRQIRRFLELAKVGLGAIPELRDAAIRYGKGLNGTKRGRSLDPLKKNTIKSYVLGILFGLGYIDLPEDIGIEDLMRIVPTVRIINGREMSDTHNPYVDQYRSVQADVVTEFKGKGFDKKVFKNFIDGLNAVAVFNGYFELVEPFNRAYKLRYDIKKKQERKKKKRRVMTRSWLNENIVDLSIRFKRIIRKGSFKEDHKDIELCLFLVQLIVLRYLGYRQQCLRNCRIGIHITVVHNKSVTFRWGAGEIKNEVDIDTTISMEQHGHIPELVLLINVLSKYSKYVLPYLPELYKRLYGAEYLSRYEEQMGDSFFGYVEQGGAVCRFRSDEEDDDDNKIFYAKFQQAAYGLMDFMSLKDNSVSFHPHFLRGVCCDWMHYDLEMSWADIAQVLGDTEWTVRKEYFDESDLKSATKPFETVSTRRAEKQLLELEASANKNSEKTISVMTDHIKLLGEKAEFYQEKSARVEEELRASREDSESKDRTIAELLAEVARLRSLDPAQLVAA